ncbi:MAG: DUF5916 domain-containing protein, partial [Bacteroidota bacterium]
MKRLFSLCLVLTLVAPSAAFATAPTTAPTTALATEDDPPETRPSLIAQRTTEAIAIDGMLDEDSWNTAALASEFQQYEPQEGAPASQQTEVRILYSNNAVYIGAYMYDEAPEKILRTLGRRDDLNQADWFLVAIDSYYDRKTSYNFGVNAAGIQVDGVNTDASSFRFGPLVFDTSWDAVWASAVRVHEDGWSVEMRIPYSMLRFPELTEQTWGINFRRVIPRNSETSEWSLIRREDYAGGSVANYGTLTGLKNIKPRRNIQFIPYTVSGMRFEEGDPGQSVNSRDLDVGVDLKFGITSNITLDATINPDFGQVEADPAVLNLTVFETILQERRPFFVEGFQIFDYRFGFRDGLLYTRRIGAQAPVIGATKLSGRTDSGFSFGFLGALTGTNFDPTRLYSVGRVIQQIGDYSSVGAILTAFDKSVLDDTPLRSYTGGVDWDLRFNSNRYRLDGHFSFSNRFTPGDKSATQDTGIATALGFDKTRGIWTWGFGTEIMSDAFNPRDMGLLRRNDQLRFSAYINNVVNGGKSFGPFERGSLRMFNWNDWSYDRSLYTGSGFFFFSSWLTKGFREFDIQIINRDPFGGYNQFDTRGLYPRANPYSLDIELSTLSDSRRAWQVGPAVEAGFADGEGAEYELGIEGVWNVGSRLNLQAELGFGVEHNRLAWASNESFRATETGWTIGNENGTAPDELAAGDFTSFDDQGQLASILALAEPFAVGSTDYYVPVYGRRNNRSVDFSVSPLLGSSLGSYLIWVGGRSWVEYIIDRL